MALLGDYTQTRSALAVGGLTVITWLVAKKLIGDVCYASCFGAIFACFTAHSLCDDKFPDRNGA